MTEGPWALLSCASLGHGVGVHDSTVIEVCRALGDPVHLKTLSKVGSTSGERRGRWVDCSLVPAAFEASSGTLAPAVSEMGRDGVGEVCPSWAFSSVS